MDEAWSRLGDKNASADDTFRSRGRLTARPTRLRAATVLSLDHDVLEINCGSPDDLNCDIDDLLRDMLLC